MSGARGEPKPPAPRGGPFTRRVLRGLLFPLGVLVGYGAVAIFSPPRAVAALHASARTAVHLLIPLGVVFGVLLALNLFVKPASVARWLGKGSGAKGVGLSTLAGVLSMGPIYAWYPLLADLREKGATGFHLANFLGCRAVKPFLLPLMVYYFGWAFTVVVNILLVVGALLTGVVVGTSCAPEDDADSGREQPDSPDGL